MFNFLRPVLKRRISLRNDIQQIPLLAAFVDEISGKAGLDAELTARIKNDTGAGASGHRIRVTEPLSLLFSLAYTGG